MRWLTSWCAACIQQSSDHLAGPLPGRGSVKPCLPACCQGDWPSRLLPTRTLPLPSVLHAKRSNGSSRRHRSWPHQEPPHLHGREAVEVQEGQHVRHEALQKVKHALPRLLPKDSHKEGGLPGNLRDRAGPAGSDSNSA